MPQIPFPGTPDIYDAVGQWLKLEGLPWEVAPAWRKCGPASWVKWDPEGQVVAESNLTINWSHVNKNELRNQMKSVVNTYEQI